MTHLTKVSKLFLVLLAVEVLAGTSQHDVTCDVLHELWCASADGQDCGHAHRLLIEPRL
jgi:hypothetical protein